MDTLSFKLEVKELDEGKGEFTGVASVYGVEDLGNDVIDPGAFRKTIQERPEVHILWGHDHKAVMGKGRVTEEGNKIIVRSTVLDMDDPQVRVNWGKVRKGLVNGLSIGFQPVKVTWEETTDRVIRHINELKLWEVSLVPIPRLPEAQVLTAKQHPALSASPASTPSPEPLKPAPQAATPGTEPALDHSLLQSLQSLLKGEA